MGVRRRPSVDASWRSLDLEHLSAWQRLRREPVTAKTLLIAIMTPDRRTPEAYRARYVDVAAQMAAWADAIDPMTPTLWVGSTAVFGETQGICMESTQPSPDGWRGRLLLDAEQLLSARARSYVIRLSGLYDVGSTERLRDPDVRARIAPASVSNRIHRDDASEWLIAYARHVLAEQPMPECLHGVDQLPLTYANLFHWLDDPATPLQLATSGRIIQTEYRAMMPPLRYPTIREGLS